MCSDKGWVNQELYLTWFKFFIAHIPPARPVLLIQHGHSSHVSLDVITLARDNDVHLLCLPSHTTHLLQPLDVGVFKSLKSNFSRACRTYLAAHPGEVITTDILASLLGQAWPQSMTPVNAMSGFRKCGIYPLNPGQILDRQLAPSRVFESVSNVTFTPEEEVLYQARLEESYDLEDPNYHQWLRLRHPEVLDDVTAECTHDTSPHSSSVTSSRKSPSVLSTCAPDSLRSNISTSSVDAAESVSNCDVLSKVLALPQPKQSKKRKPGFNSKAVCLTDDSTLQELEDKSEERRCRQEEKRSQKN